jgi:ABC-type uncharacterized transport system, permease component
MVEFLPLIFGALELGFIYAIMALGVFVSFRTLNTPDLTVDGSFVTGAAVSIVFTLIGLPFVGILLSFVVGMVAGCLTALINTKLKVAALLSGILMMLALYSINLRIMGKPNLPLNKANRNIFSFLDGLKIQLVDGAGKTTSLPLGKLIIAIAAFAIVLVLLLLFLKTRLGLGLRATGDNESMVRASGVDTDKMKIIGMALSNGLVALSGGINAQYNKLSDINMGTGMVVIGLASVIIGEVIFGTSNIVRRLVAVGLGAVVYRAILAVALRLGLESSDLKLVTAVIVLIALSAPMIKGKFKLGGKQHA